MGRTRIPAHRTSWTIIVLLALLLAACGTDTPTQDTASPGTGTDGDTADGDGATSDAPVDLTGKSLVASSSQPGALATPMFYAFDLLRDWGLDLQVEVLTTTPGVQALVAGRTQLAPHGADELILGAAEGALPVAVGATEAQQGYVLVGSTEYASVADLEGKVIGMSGPAGFDALLSRFALQDVGLDPDADASFVQIGGSPDRAAALLGGNVDAATIFVDDWFELEGRTEDLHIILQLAELVPDYPATVYFSLADFWQDNPDIALAVACANLESNKWAQDNPDEFVAFAQELVEGASPEAIRNLYDFAIEVGMYPTDPDAVLSTRGMQGLMEAMLETGDISQPVEVDQVVDTSYLQEAAQMGCGQ